MLSIALYQMHSKVGFLEENLRKILDFYNNNLDKDLLITPELALCGYSPQDDLFAPDFKAELNKVTEHIIKNTQGKNPTLILGTVYFEANNIYNVALVIKNGKILEIIYKNKLPNYGVFNEQRYFSTKITNNTVDINGVRVGIFICEDMWHKDYIKKVVDQKPDLLISINASPFELGKNQSRFNVVKDVYDKINVPLVYLNLVGGQDSVVFDGASFFINEYKNLDGLLNVESYNPGFLNIFQEDVAVIVYDKNKLSFSNSNSYIPALWKAKDEEVIYQALILGTRDFIKYCGFKGVALGISGGVDSAITAVIAADALGAQNIKLISLPSKYTSTLSKKIIKELVDNLGVEFYEIEIDSILKSYDNNLSNILDFDKNSLAENLQARIRGNILMAFVNQHKDLMLLTTGNKSEIATGYSTLYGDSCGGFNIIKDLYKQQVFALCKYRNANIPKGTLLDKLSILPEEVINRKPSAELKENQYDEDNLMDYKILDSILYKIIEENKSLGELYAEFDSNLVDKAVILLKNSHYKRQQSAPGINISTRAFGDNYKYPIVSGFSKNKKINFDNIS
jgi:NAD+ synthase